MIATTAYIALGSNLCNRRATLDAALDALRKTPRVRVASVSAYHETEPVGGPTGQSTYLNAATAIETDLGPLELLQVLQKIELKHGRTRDVHCGPRTLDLDLLLYGDQIIDEPNLSVPHPRMHLRRFVLEPLAEIASQVRHPRTGRTIAELLAALDAD